MRRRLLILLAALVAAFLLIQLVPYRVTDPSTRAEPAWDSPRTRQLAVAACFDCHSNETHVAMWERVAPLSWWITNHVRDGRAALNFSEWSSGHRGRADKAAEVVANGTMPPSYYTWMGMHGPASLTAAERRELAAGLRKTLGGG
ncbi:MAG: Cytochrome c [Actinomycetia bacterium]|nr:Cytochrome c [Actinomycetes bacterium]